LVLRFLRRGEPEWRAVDQRLRFLVPRITEGAGPPDNDEFKSIKRRLLAVPSSSLGIIRYSALVFQLTLSKFLNLSGGPAWMRTHCVRLSHLPFLQQLDCQHSKRNEYVDPTGRVHATGNQVPWPPDGGHDRVSLRRMGGYLAWWLNLGLALVSGDGRAEPRVAR